MNARRGLVRLLIVASGVYWICAVAVAVDSYGSPPDAPPASAFVLLGSDGKTYVVEPNEVGPTCERSRAAIDQLVQEAYRATLVADACAREPETRRQLAAKQGRREVARRLGVAAAVFAAIVAAVAAACWIVAGFRSSKASEQ